MGVAWFRWRPQGGQWAYNYDKGIWVTKMPPITKPKAKVEFIDIPGRSRAVTVSEGEYAYQPYVKEIVITVPMIRYIPSSIPGGAGTVEQVDETALVALHEWLRGDGFLQLSTEPNYRYRAYIAEKIDFRKIAEDLYQATIPFYCQPDRLTMHEVDFRFTDSERGIDTYTDDNQNILDVLGNYPTTLITYVSRRGDDLTSPADLSVSFVRVEQETPPEGMEEGGTGYGFDNWVETDDVQTMVFHDMTAGSCHVLSAAQICTNADEDAIWTKPVEGEYWELLPGRYKVKTNIPARVIIHVNWRWV